MENKNSGNKKHCENILNRYLLLDKGERVPLSVSLHLLRCSKCREKIELLKKAEKELSAPLTIECPVTDESIQKVLSEIQPQVKDKFYKPLPFHLWILFGIIMITFLFSSLITTQDMNSKPLSIWYALTIAGCVTVYWAVFVVSHIDLFIKKISTIIKNIA